MSVTTPHARCCAPALGIASLLIASGAHATPPPFAAPFLSYPLAFGGGALEIADVDRDGAADLLVAGAGSVSILLGSLDGTFRPGTPAVGGVAPAFRDAFATADLDGDGNVDYVLARDSVTVGVALGDGAGHFSALVPYAAPKAPVALALADVNGDHVLDLVSVSDRAHNVAVMLGQGNGSFASPTTYATGLRPVSVAVADLDLDGDLDLIVANQQDQTLSRLLGDGTGLFGPTTPLPLPGAPGRVVVARLDADALPDLLVGTISSNGFFVLPGTGGGGFGAAQTVTLPAAAIDVAVGDVDADGIPDVCGVLYDASRAAVCRGLGGFAFAPPFLMVTGRTPIAASFTDANGTGKLDLVVLGGFGSLSVHMGNGDGTFGGRPDVSVGSQPWSVAAGDLDGDGHADLVSANAGAGTLSIARGLGDGTFAPAVSLACGIETRGITLADVNGDSHLDLLVANHGPGTQTQSSISVFLGDGELGFAPRADYAVGRWCEQIAVGDWNGDGHPDLAVALDDFNATLTLLDGTGDGHFTNRRDESIGSNATSVAFGDVTRDGKLDILLAAYSSNTAYVLPGNGNGTHSGALSLPVSGNARGIASGDIDGDGFADVVVGHFAVTVFRSLPGGTFAAGNTVAAGGGPLAVGDLDGDGRADVVTANDWPTSSLSVLYAQSSGVLGERIDLGAGERPMGVTLADVDADGRPDLVSANLGSDGLSVLLNTGGIAWLPWLGAPGPPAASTRLRAWPNPGRDAVSFAFELPAAGRVRLRLYDLGGRLLATVLDGPSGPGEQRVSWSRLASLGPAGVCFAELVTPGQRQVRRIVLLP